MKLRRKEFCPFHRSPYCCGPSWSRSTVLLPEFAGALYFFSYDQKIALGVSVYSFHTMED